MASSRPVALGLLLAALATGCGEGSEPRAAGTTELARAERSLRAELEAAAESLGPAVQVAPGERVAPSPCDDPRRREVTGGYRIRLSLGSGAQPAELLEQAEAFWRKRGRDVRVRGRHGRFPAVFATADPGWTFALQVFPERKEALLSGGTPCLPEPPA
jgi:hypothetical protein